MSGCNDAFEHHSLTRAVSTGGCKWQGTDINLKENYASTIGMASVFPNIKPTLKDEAVRHPNLIDVNYPAL